MKLILFLVLILVPRLGLSDACQCVGAEKDYDPQKGFYFDKITPGLVSHISARFSCTYTCKDSRGGLWKVSYIHEETRKGKKGGGPENAKWFLCDNSVGRFIPHYSLDQISYFEAIPYGPFNPALANRPELKSFAREKCR